MTKDKNEYARFGFKVLRTMREDAELSQLEMSELLDIDNTTVSKWELGKSCPDVVQFRAWCKACHKNGLPYLLDWDNPQTYESSPYLGPLTSSMAYMSEDSQKMLYSALTQDFWPALLQLLTVYLDVPLRGRIIALENLLAIHRAARNESHLRPEEVGRERVKPDIALLRKYVSSALKATENGLENYYVED